MNNDELDKILKSASVPKRAEEYWREFPKKVTAKLHWQPKTAVDLDQREGWNWKLIFGPAMGVAAIVVAALLVVHFHTPSSKPEVAALKDQQLAVARKCYQELESLFPNQVQAIVFDESGPRLVLAAKADVPNSTPLYLKVCGPKGCEGFVTFSGQQIQVNGENCEVLSNGKGKVLLVGNHHVWDETSPSDAIRIQAKPLGMVL